MFFHIAVECTRRRGDLNVDRILWSSRRLDSATTSHAQPGYGRRFERGEEAESAGSSSRYWWFKDIASVTHVQTDFVTLASAQTIVVESAATLVFVVRL
jgi:hypothetical protein